MSLCNPASRALSSGTLLNESSDPFEHTLFAQDFHQVIEARADSASGAGEARGMHDEADLDCRIHSHLLEENADCIDVEILRLFDGRAQRLHDSLVLSG